MCLSEDSLGWGPDLAWDVCGDCLSAVNLSRDVEVVFNWKYRIQRKHLEVAIHTPQLQHHQHREFQAFPLLEHMYSPGPKTTGVLLRLPLIKEHETICSERKQLLRDSFIM